jgi:4-hydroxy-tetrahydrodipicolinate synthase
MQNTLRREFLGLMGAGLLGSALSSRPATAAPASGSKALRGIFPIACTPFTESDKLDLDSLVAELKFFDRGGVHGFVWPQNWSEWRTLSQKERLDGAEALLAASKGVQTAVVIGVQGPDLATAVGYAKHAEKLGADGIMSLPPVETTTPPAITEYYKEVAKATSLPLFVQAVGMITLDQLIELYKAIPTFRYLKDEAEGSMLKRILPLREASGDQLKVFSGQGGRTLISEMLRGSSGSMPTAAFPDLFARTWDLWHEGKQNEAMDMHARTQLCLSEVDLQAPAGASNPESSKYVLCLRGVFKNSRIRPLPGRNGSAPPPLPMSESIDEAGKKALRNIMEYAKPFLRA